jgi:2-polyprenyl-3-methyl-5-hydroxy-6-metoxy-1,4-benzoquinol methylase
MRCLECGLSFVPLEDHLSVSEEKLRYDEHENNPEDLRYQHYLSGIADSMMPYLSAGMRGLDYGCGSSKLMATIFASRGLEVDSYDLFYHPEKLFLDQAYDFILLSEVIEHLRDPLSVLKELRLKLSGNGQIFVKTMFSPSDPIKFSNWFYKRDLTHIVFFNESSMLKLGELLELKWEDIPGKDLTRFFRTTQS